MAVKVDALQSEVTKSRDVDSHESRTPPAGSRDRVAPWQLYTVAPSLGGLLGNWK